MRGWPTLFEMEVVHRYYATPSDARFAFTPLPGTAAWLAAGRCVLRTAGNALRAYRPAGQPGDRPTPALAFPATLAFAARPLDPLFTAFTAPLQPVYSLGDPHTDWAPPGALDPLPPAASAGPPAISLRLELTLSADPGDAPKTFSVELAAREVTWTYLLAGDWKGDSPRVVQAGAGPEAPPAFAPENVTLADGRGAVAFRSAAPLALSQRPPSTFQLMAGERTLIRSLPGADPANLALVPSSPQQAPDAAAAGLPMTCEIFVCR